jgi:hypothetical protein
MKNDTYGELVDIWEGCPSTHEVDHFHPLTGRWWTGKLEPTDDPRWATEYDGEDGSTRISCGLNIPVNLQPLPEAINSSKSNKPPAPGVFDWWSHHDNEPPRAALPSEWSPSDGYDA